MELELEPSAFWTDSESVLKYIKNENRRFKTYVANRISDIRELSDKHQWRHISSKENPADDVSRGLSIEAFLKSKKWFQGPEFLAKPDTEWPNALKDFPPIESNDPEVKKETIVNSLIVEAKSPLSKLIEYYSNWNRLKRAVAWMLKFRALLQKRRLCRVTRNTQTDLKFKAKVGQK